jgi:hypothetical protein
VLRPEDDLAVAVLGARSGVEEKLDLGGRRWSKRAAPFSQNTSKISELAWPAATRDTSSAPTPEANAAEYPA